MMQTRSYLIKVKSRAWYRERTPKQGNSDTVEGDGGKVREGIVGVVAAPTVTVSDAAIAP